jgi:hypothetical protein
MTEFWDDFFACENDGLVFIHDNGWEIDTYDVKIIVNPETYSLDVEGIAHGIALLDREELRFLLGFNFEYPDRSCCDMEYISLNGFRCAVDRTAFKYTLRPQHALSKGTEIQLEFRYHIVPLARKCWVNSRSNGCVPGLGDGETELCFEGFWLPFANDRYQMVTATIHVKCPSHLTVISNGALIEANCTTAGYTQSYRMRMPGFPTVVAGTFELAEKRHPGGADIQFYHQPGYSEVAAQVVERAALVRSRLVDWLSFNPPGSLGLVQLRRTSFGQYAYFPLVLFPKDDVARTVEAIDLERLTSMLGHEIGHFWFGLLLRDQGNEQWISEGFAQYLSLCTIENFYGPEARDRHLQKHMKILEGSDFRAHPPLYNIPQTHPLQPILVRSKTALILHYLRQQIGSDQMCALLAALVYQHKGKNVTTKDIEETWSANLPGFDIRSFFRTHIWNNSVLYWNPTEHSIYAASTT